jgi:hypothetical protein
VRGCLINRFAVLLLFASSSRRSRNLRSSRNRSRGYSCSHSCCFGRIRCNHSPRIGRRFVDSLDLFAVNVGMPKTRYSGFM